ncbi:POLE2 [Auxenochlorella protothecoides x Auxenochlorella symbiontica]
MASGEESRATRVWLQKQFRTSGLQLDPGALSYLVDAVQGLHDPEEYIHRIMDEASAGAQRRLTLESLEGLVRRLDGARAQTSGTQVIPAFQTPVLEYDPIRKQFHASPAPPRLFPEAKSKIALYVNRYHLVHQRLRRNRLFRPTHWAGVAGAQGQECEVGWSERVGSRHAGGQHVLGCARAGVPALGAPGASQDRRVLLEPARALCMAPPPPPSSTRQLTELKALLGLVGQSKYVLGFLSQPREGEYALEDLSARLPLDIQDAERTPGLFTENSIVVAEGQLQPSGRFKAVALGMPPPESRAASIEALQGLVTFGGSEPDAKEAAAWDASHPDDATLLLSDVWLDDACAMANLEALLATLAEADASSQPPPSLIVLCGDFLSPAGRRAVVGGGAAKTSAAGGAGGGLMGECRRAFDGLGRLLAQFPAVQEKSTLVLVPGPEDVGLGRALPHPGLPRAVLQGLLSAAPNTIVGSNPCRLRHGSCELVVLRSNLQCLLRGTAVVPPMPGSTPFQHAVASVAQQSHLCPVPLEVQPIHWEHDRALWLYPLPHALFLADSAPAGHHVYDSCVSLNPGSLVQGTYCSFNPFTRLGKVCSVQGKGEWQSQEAAVEMD